MDNYTFKDEASLAARARQNAVLCILGIIFNLTLLLVACLSERLRRSTKYQLIASLSLADLLIGLIYLPLDTSMAFHRGEWIYSCELMFFTYGLQEFVIPTVASLTLTLLCVEYSITMCHDVTPGIKRRVVTVGVVGPWLAGGLAWVPVFVSRFVTASGSFTHPCVSEEWDASVVIVVLGLFGYVPILLLLPALLVMLICHFRRPPDEIMAARTIRARSHGVLLTHEIADTSFACVISMAFNLPFLLDYALHVQCEGRTCHSPKRMQHVLEVLRTAESVFFPAVWMLGLEFRRGLFTSCKCCSKYCLGETGNQV